MPIMTDADRIADKKRRDGEWAEAHKPNGEMDNSGYHNADTGEFIPLRNAPDGLMSGTTGTSGSGDIHVYDKTSDTYHRVVKGDGRPNLSKEFAANHNREIRSALFTDDRPEATPSEIDHYAKRAAERAKEKEEGYHTPYN